MGASAGILSYLLWGFGGLGKITHTLETIYLSLAAVWLITLGGILRKNKKEFGYFTFIVGIFTALDAIFNLFEPIPFVLYLAASPKLPLSAIWSISAGILLLNHDKRTN